jgi:hypothetical protein
LFVITGTPDVILSAGAFVNKPGLHGKGRAFDLDGIIWPDKTFVTLSAGFGNQDRAFYYGIEAFLRKHFGIVLDYNFNADHRDHFHMDDSEGVGFKAGSRSRVKFLQGALTHVHGIPVVVDGDFGQLTKAATQQVLGDLGIAGSITNGAVWDDFLSATLKRGIGLPAATVEMPGADPLDLIHDVYSIINEQLAGSAAKDPIVSSLNAFANNPQTQAWLDQFRK